MRPYIGITGFTATDEVAAALNIMNLQPAKFNPYRMMVGVLANYDTLQGHLCQRFPMRYPEISRTSRLFPESDDVLNLYHYNTPNQEFLSELEQLIYFGGKDLDGFQLNIAWPNPRLLEQFRNDGNKQIIVQQIGGKAFNRISNDPKKLVEKIKKEYVDWVDYILLDPSGGTGTEMNIDSQRRYLSELYSALINQRVMIGIAGGLSPYNISMIIPLLNEFELLSIDIEGRIRDHKTDELLFTEMSKFLWAAYSQIVCPARPKDAKPSEAEIDEQYKEWVEAGCPRDWFFESGE